MKGCLLIMPENLNENNNPQNRTVDFEKIVARELKNSTTLNDIISETEAAARYIANPPVVNENTPDQLNPEAKIREKLEDELRNIPMRNPNHYNIVLIGDTGAGKSTLINALFEQRVAQTFGGGQPGLNAPIDENVINQNNDANIGQNDAGRVLVTRYNSRAILYRSNQNCNISVWDTQGLEQGKPEIMTDTVNIITENAIRQNGADNFIDAVCMVQKFDDIRFYGTKKNAILKLNQVYKSANGNGSLPIIFVHTRVDQIAPLMLNFAMERAKKLVMVKLHYLSEANKLNTEETDILYIINNLDSTSLMYINPLLDANGKEYSLDDIRKLIDDENRKLSAPTIDEASRMAAIKKRADYEKILDLKTRFPNETFEHITNISLFDIGDLDMLPEEEYNALETDANKYSIATGCMDAMPQYNINDDIRIGIDQLKEKIRHCAKESRQAAYVRHIQENLKAHFKKVTAHAFKNAEMFRWHSNDVSKYFNELPYLKQNSVSTFISKIVRDGMSFSLRSFSKDVAEQPINIPSSDGKYIEKSLLNMGKDLSNCGYECTRESVNINEMEKEIHKALTNKLIADENKANLEKDVRKLSEKRSEQLNDTAKRIDKQRLINWYADQKVHSNGAKGKFVAGSVFSFGIVAAVQKGKKDKMVKSIIADSENIKRALILDNNTANVNNNSVNNAFSSIPDYIEDKALGMLRRGDPEAIEIFNSIGKETYKTAIEQNCNAISKVCKKNILNNWLDQMQTNYNTTIKNTIDERVADKVDSLTQDIHKNIDQKINGQMSR